MPILSYGQRTNSNNNGRSNKDRCCDDGIVFSGNGNSQPTLGSGTIWYSATVKSKKTSNPISKLAKQKSDWDVALYTSEGKYLQNMKVSIKNGEMVLPKMDLKKDSYYVELIDNGKKYRTGIKVE